jgi:hypothetical protein
MTKTIIALVGFLACTASATAQPKIEFPGSPWDFGEMLQSQAVLHKFEVRNAGKDTLFISRVKPACGCTSAPLTKDVIGPGESIWMDVTFNSKRFSGEVHKTVTFFSNDPAEPEAKLAFTATIETARKTVESLEEPVDLGNLLPNTGKQAQIRLINIGDQPYRLTVADWPGDWLEGDWTERVIDPQDTLTLTVGTHGVAPLGRFSESITFDVDGKVKSRFSLPITGIGLVE